MRLSLAVLFAATVAHAQAFKPFTPSNTVCAKCTGGPQYDRIVLTGGQEVHARVLAENEAFYVLERFGEERAVGRDQVQTIVKNPAVTHPTGFGDQILLVDGIVLAGTIEGDLAQDAQTFAINIPGSSVHHAERPTVAAIYRAGKKVYTAAK